MIYKLIFCVLFLTITRISHSQDVDYFNENLMRIDNYLNISIKDNICEGKIVFPKKYKKSWIKHDKYIVPAISYAVLETNTIEDLNTYFEKFSRKHVVVESLSYGILTFRNFLFKGHYLRANLRLGFINGKVISKRIELSTTTHASCGIYNGTMVDFNLLKKFYLNKLPHLFSIDLDNIKSEELFYNNLVPLKNEIGSYKLNMPNKDLSSWVDTLLIKQYINERDFSYDLYKAPAEFMRLIQENRIDVLVNLLYSPNYIYSINAMESLIYLSQLNRFDISQEIKERIGIIKDWKYPILKNITQDYSVNIQGYNQLGASDELVIKKYASSDINGRSNSGQ